MSYVFISYSRKDSDYVQSLCAAINEKGFDVWIDNDDIEPGDEWFEAIVEAIEECAAFLVVMTPPARKSKWVKKEITLALDLEKRTFPLQVEGDIFPILKDIQCVDLNDEAPRLPTLKFYEQLKRFVPRTPTISPQEYEIMKEQREKSIAQLVSDTAYSSSSQTIYQPEPKESPNAKEKNKIDNPFRVGKWVKFVNEGNNDFVSIAKLALAFEAEGSHERAMFHLRKAHKLEPRVIDQKWMHENYDWAEAYHKLLLQIISDEKFWACGFGRFENYFSD